MQDAALLNTPTATEEELLVIHIANQIFGIPIYQIQDVLQPQRITHIPLSRPEIEGALNLRGRIVTAINVRKRLGLEPQDHKDCISVVVEHDGEFFSLLVDKVGDVLKLDKTNFAQVPSTLDAVWKDISTGIYRLEGQLLLVLDVSSLLILEKN